MKTKITILFSLFVACLPSAILAGGAINTMPAGDGVASYDSNTGNFTFTRNGLTIFVNSAGDVTLQDGALKVHANAVFKFVVGDSQFTYNIDNDTIDYKGFNSVAQNDNLDIDIEVPTVSVTVTNTNTITQTIDSPAQPAVPGWFTFRPGGTKTW